MRLIEQDVKLNRAGAVAAGVDAATNGRTTIVLTGALVSTALLLCIVVAMITTRSIVVPIGRAVDIAETVARADLTSDIDVQQGRDKPTVASASPHEPAASGPGQPSQDKQREHSDRIGANRDRLRTSVSAPRSRPPRLKRRRQVWKSLRRRLSKIRKTRGKEMRMPTVPQK